MSDEEEAMVGYEVVLRDGTSECISGADAYAQEGQLTTFFRTDGIGRGIDAWSTRMASVRTAEISVVRRLEPDRALSA